MYTGAGIFTMNIVGSVPGQSIQEVPLGAIPTLGEWGLIALTAIIVLSGLFVLRRRRTAFHRMT